MIQSYKKNNDDEEDLDRQIVAKRGSPPPPPLDPLITLQVPMDYYTKSETPMGSASSRSSISSVCFLPHLKGGGLRDNDTHDNKNDDENDDNEGDDDSTTSSSRSCEEELKFKCRTLLQSESRSAWDPTRQARQSAAATTLLQTPASNTSGSNRFLASCHANGECLLWDLGQRTIVHNYNLVGEHDNNQNNNRGPGWMLRRIEQTDRFFYQTRDVAGTVSIHAWDHGSAAADAFAGCSNTSATTTMAAPPILSFRTYSQTFCAAAPCTNNGNLLALPSAKDSDVTIRDLRIDPVTSRPVAVFAGYRGFMESADKQDCSSHLNIRKHGMLTSLAFSESSSTFFGSNENESIIGGNSSGGSRPIVACGMESGTVFFHDLRMILRQQQAEQQSSTPPTSCHYFKLADDPVLALDLAPSHGTGASSRINRSDNTDETTKRGVVAIAGMAGEAIEQKELPISEQGTVAILKATVQEASTYNVGGVTNESAFLRLRLRARLATCRLTGDGKPGVNLCRFQPGGGRLFAVAGWDQRVRIFDRAAQAHSKKHSDKNNSLLAILRGHEASVSTIDWAPDSSVSGLCATGAADGKIHIWRCFSK